MTNYRIERAKDPQDLARQACETIAAQIDLALGQRDRCQIALSGGTTPSKAYSLLGQERLPWDRVDVVLGDERWVAADDASSNAGMYRALLALALVPRLPFIRCRRLNWRPLRLVLKPLPTRSPPCVQGLHRCST